MPFLAHCISPCHVGYAHKRPPWCSSPQPATCMPCSSSHPHFFTGRAFNARSLPMSLPCIHEHCSHASLSTIAAFGLGELWAPGAFCSFLLTLSGHEPRFSSNIGCSTSQVLILLQTEPTGALPCPVAISSILQRRRSCEQWHGIYAVVGHSRVVTLTRCSRCNVAQDRMAYAVHLSPGQLEKPETLRETSR